MIADQLDQKASLFKRHDLKPGEIALIVSNELEDQRESEVRLYFYRGRNIVDALEFHVYKRGKLDVDVDRISDWVANVLEDVVKKAAGAR